MTSGAKAETNRSNGRKSRGPKTGAGKARSAQNALRHGLAVPVSLDVVWAPEVDALARRIAGERPAPELLELARLVAEAQIDLVRVRTSRRHIEEQENAVNRRQASEQKLNALLLQFKDRDPNYKDEDPRVAVILDRLLPLEKLVAGQLSKSQLKALAILDPLARQLAALDRYERRALSRRKFAVRAFDLWRVKGK